MSLRWRNYGRGELLCAAKHPPKSDDSYIDDALHYRLAVELGVIVPDDDEAETGRWRWQQEAGMLDALPE